jgi:hypothetical protein
MGRLDSFRSSPSGSYIRRPVLSPAAEELARLQGEAEAQRARADSLEAENRRLRESIETLRTAAGMDVACGSEEDNGDGG